LLSAQNDEPDASPAIDRLERSRHADPHRTHWQHSASRVIDVLNPDIESPEFVRDRVLQAAEYIPIARLGTADDCGFSPFADDTSTGRDTAFAKIRARVVGTQLAATALKLD